MIGRDYARVAIRLHGYQKKTTRLAEVWMVQCLALRRINVLDSVGRPNRSARGTLDWEFHEKSALQAANRRRFNDGSS